MLLFLGDFSLHSAKICLSIILALPELKECASEKRIHMRPLPNNWFWYWWSLLNWDIYTSVIMSGTHITLISWVCSYTGETKRWCLNDRQNAIYILYESLYKVWILSKRQVTLSPDFIFMEIPFKPILCVNQPNFFCDNNNIFRAKPSVLNFFEWKNSESYAD